MIVYDRAYEGRRLLIMGNFSDRTRTCALPLGFRPERLRVRLSNYEGQVPAGSLTLRPYEAIVFEAL